MADSVNLNPFVSSSILEYKKLLEGKEVENPKTNQTTPTPTEEDEEYGLEADYTEKDGKTLSESVDKMIEKFTDEVNYNVTYQVISSVSNDWETGDDTISQINKNGLNDINQYKTLLNKAMNSFLSQYTGDGTNIESEFKAYYTKMLKDNNGLKSLTQKYDNTEITKNAQKEYDNAVEELDKLEKSGKNDKETQSRKSHLEIIIHNNKLLLNKQT